AAGGGAAASGVVDDVLLHQELCGGRIGDGESFVDADARPAGVICVTAVAIGRASGRVGELDDAVAGAARELQEPAGFIADEGAEDAAVGVRLDREAAGGGAAASGVVDDVLLHQELCGGRNRDSESFVDADARPAGVICVTAVDGLPVEDTSAA